MVYQGYRGGLALSKGDPTFSRGGVAWVQLLIPIIIERLTFQGKGCPYSLTLSKNTYAYL